MASSLNFKAIATKAGVSSATVSYALSGKAGVSEKTRKRIVAIAEAVGYKPDAALVTLMAHVSTRRSRTPTATLALITDHGGPRPWSGNLSVRALWEGAGARALELGYRLEEFWYGEPGLSPTRLRNILIARGIQGLLFSSANTFNLRLDFDCSGFACAMSGLCFSEPAVSYVLPHHHRNMQIMWERVHALGYRRPLLALPGGASERMEHMAEAAYFYFCSVHPDVRGLPVYRSNDYEHAPFKAFVDEHRPDVIACTMGDWVKRLGTRVPREMGFVSLNWAEGDKHLAGVDRRLKDQAACVVDMVVAALHRRELGVPKVRKEVFVAGRFVDGPSLPPRKVRAAAAGLRARQPLLGLTK